jgi:predicted phosphodiesterase
MASKKKKRKKTVRKKTGHGVCRNPATDGRCRGNHRRGGPSQKLVLECLDAYPSISSRAAARLLYNENPQVWRTLNACYMAVRRERGATGELTRKYARRANAPQREGFDNIPEGILCLEDCEPYKLKAKKPLILADVHVPYHDKEALLVALDHAVKQDCDHVLWLGDAIDFYQFSSFIRDPRKRSIGQELDVWCEIVSIVKEAFPNQTFRSGNHEDRYLRYLKVKAPELMGMEIFDMPTLLHLPELGVDYVPELAIVQMGHLSALHGHEWRYGISNPVNPARGFYLRAKATCIAGHLHQTSMHVEKDLHDNVITCWSIGCLCDMKPSYSPYNKWNHGFAIVEVDTDGEFRVHNHRIFDGHVL